MGSLGACETNCCQWCDCKITNPTNTVICGGAGCNNVYFATHSSINSQTQLLNWHIQVFTTRPSPNADGQVVSSKADLLALLERLPKDEGAVVVNQLGERLAVACHPVAGCFFSVGDENLALSGRMHATAHDDDFDDANDDAQVKAENAFQTFLEHLPPMLFSASVVCPVMGLDLKSYIDAM